MMFMPSRLARAVDVARTDDFDRLVARGDRIHAAALQRIVDDAARQPAFGARIESVGDR